MKIIVNDTNIFIDFHSIGLLESMCRLPYEIHTVDFVAAEISDPIQKRDFNDLVDANLITVNCFTAQEVTEIVLEHSSIAGNLSITDCSVCYYARKHNIPMLTGDRRLRRYSQQQQIEVHGILFLFDEMVRHAVITPASAADKLLALLNINSRLPRAEIAHRISLWTE